jgi:hypothetical protein
MHSTVGIINVDDSNSAVVSEGRLRTEAIDFFYSIGLGEVEDHEPVYISGYNPLTGSTKEVISPISATIPFPFPTAATTLDVVSDDAEDGAGTQTGALTIRIQGLGAGYIELTPEIVTLNGTTPVVTVNEYLRVNEVRVIDPGSAETNLGIIDIKDGANIISRISFSAGQGEGRAQMGVYTVPAGKEILLCRVFGSTVGGNNAHLHTSIREFGKSWVTERHFTLKDAPFSANWTYGLLVPEKTDILLIAHSTGAGAEVDAGLCGFLRPTPT